METEEKIAHLQSLLLLMKREKDREELLEFPWVGNLGTWFWNVPADIVVCNDQKIKNLGYVDEEIPQQLGYSFFTEKLHPDDYEPVMESMRKHLSGKEQVYETEYRIKTKDGQWRWYYDRGKIVERDEQGKPIHLAGIVFDITRQKELEQRVEEQNKILKDLADKDPLTGLLNRRALFRIMEENASMSSFVLLIDLDFFKSINDRFGHLVGDQVLQQASSIISMNVRETDIVGRYGGEEFLVFLTDISDVKMTEIAERIRKAFEDKQMINDIKVTVSGGIVACSNRHIDIVIDEADRLLYKAKREGRNRIYGPYVQG
ncbi:MAG: sensor domain-containing diguanylate cyclase [Sphaerochaetaceae bacterium]|jgi:diguanylate cyclase (GGDEF)-like protein/PAS domain S-box-containing protein|nr:sensor domain-containing diguanylate cyclase [Sphaerochaetaceae bacterium]NLO61075.1 sensor domain-containing diguanylate cyclase [Spirochaetales bacterium]MDD2405308.1 sensor domain-containing diguanylate cyclase [Sphaerochaetaceae bacterium]MDD3671594.1 sensor domain-containing diguanylate cyclase [Sphaerochaetaceae bacterium]MDD4259945.1 sensor domain-containing diguanylate cyclase [Sphaerochaetaceae bacterium]